MSQQIDFENICIREDNMDDDDYLPMNSSCEMTGICLCPIVYKLSLKTAQLPCKEHEDNAEYALYSPEEHIIDPDHQKLINTGIKLALPSHIFGQIISHSDFGVEVKNEIINSRDRGNIFVTLKNQSQNPYHIKIGSKIAQILFLPCFTATWLRLDFIPWQDYKIR